MTRRHSIQKIFDRDHGRCRYCAKKVRIKGRGKWSWPQGTIDHIIPKVRGGTDALANLVLACRHCNHAKGDMMWAPKPPGPMVKTPDFDSGNGGSSPPEAASR